MEAAFQSGFASALLDVLFNKVTDVLIVEIKKVLQSDVALGKLETTILQAQNLLKDVDTSELKGTIKNRLQDRIDKLISLYYDAEDLMGDIVSLIKSKWTIARGISKLQEKLDTILVELKSLVELTSHYKSKIRDPKLYVRHKPKLDMPFFGRQDDVEAITQDLISCTSLYRGVSIVGMDGLGKTMLARKIRNEARIIAHFSLSLWVDVKDGCFNLDETIEKLDQTLAEKVSHSTSNLLITFDNLLEVKLGDWSTLILHITSKGTSEKRYTNVRFLITTFSPKVVTNTRTTSYYLGPLCDEDCKEVIVATAKSLNLNMSEMYFPNDVTLTLAQNSGGLPLVASLLGAFLAEFGLEKVRSILREGLWDSTEFQEEILPVFKPSYSKIQSHLNRCLAYFSIFPKDTHLVADELVHLWVGEGFIQDTKSAPKLIEIGREHFNELLGMSILRRVDKMPQSGIPTYELNHFGHKFAKLAASKTCLYLSQGVSPSNLKTRHLSLFYDVNSWPQWDDLKKLKALRTFFALFRSNIGKIPPSAFKKLTRLRVLSLSGSDVYNIPDSIHCLKRLCYLDISRTPIKSLPKTFCELRALRFLKLIKDEGTLESFPKNFQKLTNLIHIDWEVRDIRHIGLPSHIGKLASLQTLPLFPVGDKVGHHISELQDMEHLQGSILITNLENVKDWAMAKVAKLRTKSFRRVELEWKKRDELEWKKRDELEWKKSNSTEKCVLSCLEPCPNLKELKITNYHGDAFPKWLTTSETELEEMHLQNCPNVQGLPMHVQNCPNVQGLPMQDLFTSLKILILEKMSNVIKVDHHFFGKGHFKKLDSLELKHMEQLHSWIVESESNVMPCLHALKFIDCPNLINMSSLTHLSSLEELYFQRCGALSSLPDIPISLRTLIIEESDLLEDRCKEGGQDWNKVNCIPHVEIGYQKIPTSSSNALNPDKWLEFKLHETANVSHNTKLYRFTFDPDVKLGLDIASCILTRAPIGQNDEGKTKYVIRPYTPISDPDSKGYFDLMIKIYPEGKMSQHFAKLRPGDVLEVKGPIEKIRYTPNMKKHIGMIAGGSGVTPMLQVVEAILKNPDDKTQVSLVYANISPDDILLKQKLDILATSHTKFKVFYTVDNPSKNWKGGVGYVSNDMVAKGLPGPSNDTLILVCGPPGMMDHISGNKAKDYSQGELSGVLKELGYTEEMVYKF